LTQLPLQPVWPALQQTLLEQVCPVPHAMPQPPQLASSSAVVEQPAVQHDWPAVHVALHVWQCAALSSTQLPAQQS
jgi:hypothetical protein